MSTTFPTSKQTFTTHVDNSASDLIDAADINDVQDTVAALEDAVGYGSTDGVLPDDLVFANTKAAKFKNAAGTADGQLSEDGSNVITLKAGSGGLILTDTNGNELLKTTATGSAINEVTLANAAAGANPHFDATGGDTNIGINLVPKGTGSVVIRRSDNTNGLSITDDGTDAIINKVAAANNIRFKINSVSLYAMDASALYPASDNALKCGASGVRWSEVWAANGTIQTSFLSEKDVSKWVDDEECLKQLPRVIEYTWKSEADREDKKTHLGIVADDLPLVATMGDGKNIESMAVTAIAIGACRALLRRIEKLEANAKE